MFGVLLLAYLVRRAGPAKLLRKHFYSGMGTEPGDCSGRSFAPGEDLGMAPDILLDEKHHVSFARMLGLRLASEAVGQLGGLGQLFGETLRVSLLGSTMPLASGISVGDA